MSGTIRSISCSAMKGVEPLPLSMVLGRSLRPIACLLCVLLLEGCVTTAPHMARFRVEATESRCTVPTIEQLTAFPALPVLPGREENQPGGGIPLSQDSARLATLLGFDRALRDLFVLQQGHTAHAGPSAEFL